MNTKTITTRTSTTIADVLADVRHAQRRLTQLNRPWVASNTSR